MNTHAKHTRPLSLSPQAYSDRIKHLQSQAARAARRAQQEADSGSSRQQAAAAAVPRAIAQEAQALRAELVDLHGSMVLLQHWWVAGPVQGKNCTRVLFMTRVACPAQPLLDLPQPPPPPPPNQITAGA